MPVFYNIFQLLDQPMVVVRIVKDAVIIHEVNQAFCRLAGYESDKLKGKMFNELVNHMCPKTYQRAFKKETYLTTKRNRRTHIRLEYKPLDDTKTIDGSLSLILIEDLSAQKWIEEQYEINKVLISGIVNANYHVRFLKDFFAPLLLEPDNQPEDENFLKFISETEHKRVLEAFSASARLKKMNHTKVKTSMLSGVELEITLTFMPIFDGFGKIKEYAFVIWDLNPVNDSIDSSMKLKIWMAKRDVSTNQLAVATNISIQTISKLRNGKINKPQRLTAELIASELKVDVSEIWSEVRGGR